MRIVSVTIRRCIYKINVKKRIVNAVVWIGQERMNMKNRERARTGHKRVKMR